MPFFGKVNKRICFVSPYSYSLFNPSTNYLFGGSEIRAYLFGKGLSDLPQYEVSFVVFDHKQPRVERYGEVKVFRHSYYKTYSTFFERYRKEISERVHKIDGFPYVSIRSQRIRTLLKIFIYLCNKILESAKKKWLEWSKADLKIGNYDVGFEKIRVYKEIDADIYCTFGVGNMTAEIASFCERYKKIFVLFTGSGSDFSDEYYCNSKSINPYGSVGALCHYAIMQSDFVITQSYSQKKLFADKFRKESTVIFNPIDLTKQETAEVDFVNERYALWIGKSDRIKRPEIFLKLASAFKEMKFLMVLNRSDEDIYEAIMSSKSKNVEIIERCPLDYAERLFLQAFVFVNTSIFEGFPNTFLQAGKYGVPILSLSVDPDDFIKTYSCGIVAEGQFEKLLDGFQIICNDREKATEYSRNVKRYVSSYHDLRSQVSKLDEFFRGIYEREGPSGI
jgi:hypothetical protein